MNLQSDDFELFALPRQFAQESSALEVRWKELQREAHPDRFAAHGPAAQRVAMQWSVRINEAYQRLKSPLKRAAYLCELAGFPVNAQSNTAMPPAFLMQQMQWREELDEASTHEALDTLRDNVESFQCAMLEQCASQIDVQQDYAGAVQSVRSLMFIEKFAHDLDLAFDKLED